ncbi:MAG TPA: PASTA domain-containing protein, partial [Candidatus Hydrogenedentes bacterium]|nr:PASTA domain-containing protein [Candidatus Hydrogenedentota bacterium]
DTTKAGLYTLTYTARDGAGNEAFPITRQVTVAGGSMEGEEFREGEGEAVEGEPTVKVRVPDLVLEQYENAPAILAAVNLTSGGIVYECSKEVPEGLVISQNPAAGLLVESLTPVSLVVSEGPCACGCEGGEELSWSGIFLGALALLVLLAASFGVGSGAIK